MNLTLNTYTQWYWKCDLHNLLHFLSLRMDHHAQHEIRVYADCMGEIVADWVPLAWEAFRDYRLGSAFLSAQELEVVRGTVQGQSFDTLLAASRMSAREKRELREKLGL
jgi:thymidylate synthase (FAD)